MLFHCLIIDIYAMLDDCRYASIRALFPRRLPSIFVLQPCHASPDVTSLRSFSLAIDFIFAAFFSLPPLLCHAAAIRHAAADFAVAVVAAAPPTGFGCLTLLRLPPLRYAKMRHMISLSSFSSYATDACRRHMSITPDATPPILSADAFTLLRRFRRLHAIFDATPPPARLLRAIECASHEVPRCAAQQRQRGAMRAPDE